jgi:hypothetical protein
MYQLTAKKYRQRKQQQHFLRIFHREQELILNRTPTLEEMINQKQAPENYKEYMKVLRAMPIVK